MSKILITGATGQLGHSVIEHLLKTTPAYLITALVRDESKAANLKAKGVNIAVGNYLDKASLENATKGIDKLLLISSSDFNDRIGQHKNVIDAAKKSGVKHILYTGVTMVDIENSPLKAFLSDHFLTEDYIKASGFTYTMLQNTLYTDVIPMFVGEQVINTGIFFPAGDGKVAFATRKDLAEATAKILTSEGHENKTYNLTNKVGSSFADVAAALSQLSGKTVGYISPDNEAFVGMLKSIGLPQPIIAMSEAFAAGIKNKDFEITSGTLESILGRKPTSLSDYLKETFKL
jgi:NAD(P)H dehydrogenase (quinone)